MTLVLSRAMSPHTQTTLIAIAVGLVAATAVAFWLRHRWIVARVRRAAREAEPFVIALEQAVYAFNEHFPRPSGHRLPLGDDEYPQPRPSAPRRTSSPRRRPRYRRRRW